MVLLISVGPQLETQLPTPVKVDMIWLDIKFSNVRMMGLGITILQSVDVSCYSSTTRLSSYSWLHMFIIALCSDLDTPANGTMSQSGNSEGDTATYTCDNGYELVGHQVLNCQANGTWDSHPPICRCQF